MEIEEVEKGNSTRNNTEHGPNGSQSASGPTDFLTRDSTGRLRSVNAIAAAVESTTGPKDTGSGPPAFFGYAKSRPGADGDVVACAGVKLEGQITECNSLAVAGEVVAQVRANHLVIANGGSFVGTVEATTAEIAGRFEGKLHISEQLVIRKTGRVFGEITCKQLEVEIGAELRGTIAAEEGGEQTINRNKKPLAKGWLRKA
jgi:cytoskeletal protein CcmA (bactofilin family)